VKLSDVAFIGGNGRLPSVLVRCVDIATELGCEQWLNVKSTDEIPDRFAAFFCIKPMLNSNELSKLATRGRVIWDIIDFPPLDTKAISLYLTSTFTARDFFHRVGIVEVIYHHHCNFSSVPGFPAHRRAGWIGHPYWCPNIPNLVFDRYNAFGMKHGDVVTAHRRIGIGLNIRSHNVGHDFHSFINSGIKLINCIGFGLPSVSAREAPYLEINGRFTLFSKEQDYAKSVRLLQNNHNSYQELRQACIANAERFHLCTIADHYRKLIETL
jgi:hypothetical protein